MRLVTLAAVLLCASAGIASADHYRKYFPLQQGNSWTYDSLSWEAQSQVKVEAEFSAMHYVTNLPTLGGAWLAWSGTTLYIWDTADVRWEPFLRFGAPAGTTYAVSLPDTGLWNSVTVTVAAKYATVHLTRLDRTLTGCIRFTFAFGGVADAGLTEAIFAPYRGLVRFEETSIAGPVASELTSAVTNGRNWGLNYVTGLEGGSFTGVSITGTNRVRLINSQAAWSAFYAEHKPGEAAPAVDFSTKTVCVVLAGQRPSSGYVVKVDKVVWNYPSSSVTVHVDETQPTGMVLWVITNPYHIVTLDRKVTSASVSWEVAAP